MTKKKTDPMKLFEGTVVAEIAKVAMAGEFEDLPEFTMNGEDVLGELNDFEKAANTLSNRRIKEYNALAEKANRTKAPKGEVMPELTQLEAVHEAAMALVWHSVRTRLKLYGEENLALRRGFKVVRMNAERVRAAAHVAELAMMGSVMRSIIGSVPD